MNAETVKNKYKQVENALKAKAWFKKDGWQVSTHPFPEKKPTGITFQVFKKHWFNADSHGIHIESHLDYNPKKQQKAYLTIHLLHEEKIPGTKIKRIALTKPIIDEVYTTVAEWPNYKFRVGKYGQQPFTLILDGSSSKFETELEKEVTRLCKLFGPLIDKTLLNLL